MIYLDREWQPKVTVIKDANNLLTLDITTLFGKLEEHEKKLICLEKHEKNIKKENNKDMEVKKKSISFMASGYKSSTKEHDESGTSNKENLDDEEIGVVC